MIYFGLYLGQDLLYKKILLFQLLRVELHIYTSPVLVSNQLHAYLRESNFQTHELTSWSKAAKVLSTLGLTLMNS